jgi:hypothetical protein
MTTAQQTNVCSPNNESHASPAITPQSEMNALSALGPDAVAEYIALMAAELAALAARAKFDMLGYFLKMACSEAESLYLGRK